MGRVWPLIVCAMIGCGGTPEAKPPAGPQDGDPQFGPPPPELRADLERIARLGEAIYQHDAAAARATDAVLARGAPDPRVEGWVTWIVDGKLEVYFLGDLEGAPHLFYTVRLAGDGPPAVEVATPPAPVAPLIAAAYRARTLVGGQAADLVEQAGGTWCPGPYNAVVLPGLYVDENAWLVYLLSATTDPAVRVLTGHHRVKVSVDGSTVLETTPLSRSCLSQPVATDDGQRVVGLMVDHLLSPLPVETHVFTSLLYELPLLVRTGEKRSWMLAGTDIQMIEPFRAR